MVEVVWEVSKAIAAVLLDESISDGVKDLRLSALRQITPMMDAYYREFHNEHLILTICCKKIDFILNAATKKDFGEIMSLPKIQYDGSKVRPANQFVIPEEELLVWSRTSLIALLGSAGFERFKELFLMVFPEHADIFGA